MGDLLLLSFAAGSADAAGYFSLGRVFTCNMTGNVVLFGLLVGQRHWTEALRSLTVVVLFSLGVCVGLWMSRHLDKKMWPLLVARIIGLEAALLVVFALCWSVFPAPASGHSALILLAILTPAMGLQTAALSRFQAPGVQTTAITGTITSVLNLGMEALTRPKGPPPEAKSRSLLKSLVIVLYCLGAMTTGFLVFHCRVIVGLVPALAVLLVFLHHLPATWRSLDKPGAAAH